MCSQLFRTNWIFVLRPEKECPSRTWAVLRKPCAFLENIWLSFDEWGFSKAFSKMVLCLQFCCTTTNFLVQFCGEQGASFVGVRAFENIFKNRPCGAFRAAVSGWRFAGGRRRSRFHLFAADWASEIETSRGCVIIAGGFWRRRRSRSVGVFAECLVNLVKCCCWFCVRVCCLRIT